MSDTPKTPDEFQDLRRQARLNELRLKIARQNEALGALRREGFRDTLEGFYDPSNYFDIRDYLFKSPRFGGAIPTTLGDRDEGRNFPIFRTEQELAVIRGPARLLTSSNPIAVGVLASLTNYVIGNGFQYTTTPRRTNAGELAATASAVIDEFLSENDWSGNLDRELFQRSRVDGEYFLGLWHVGGGHVQVRAIEPDQVTEPGNKGGIEEWLGCSQRFESNWAFGVHTDENDAQAVHGFYVQWSNRDTEWDYFPGGNEPIIPPQGSGMWLEHAKLNVVRSVKRGLSDFFPIDGNLELARRVLRNMGEGSAVQAAIAWIQEVAPGTTQAQVNTGTLSRADASYTTSTQQGAIRTHYVQQYDPATILKVPSGQKYLPGPLGAQHAPNFITAAEALLRTVALRWNLPEHLVTGSAANNNFASSLVAETPFVKYAESQQQFYAQRDRKTLWRVLWFAWSAGRFGNVSWPVLKRSLEITVTPPQIEVRDPEKETRVRQMLNQAGILSRKTWSAQESLDYDQEQKNLAQEAASAAGPAPADGDSSGHPLNASRGQPTESLEWWDPAKHPRDQQGRFSETDGAGSSETLDPVCFAAGTLVSTELGWRAIETISTGQRVHCVPDGQPDAAVELREVAMAFSHGQRPIIDVRAGGLALRVTPKHPFWVNDHGWTSAAELRPGDLLRRLRGDFIAVTEVSDRGEVEPVYNLRVAEHHTYFVASPGGTSAALVHNESGSAVADAPRSVKAPTAAPVPRSPPQSTPPLPPSIGGAGTLSRGAVGAAAAGAAIGAVADVAQQAYDQRMLDAYNDSLQTIDDLEQAGKLSSEQAGLWRNEIAHTPGPYSRDVLSTMLKINDAQLSGEISESQAQALIKEIKGLREQNRTSLMSLRWV